MQISWPEGFVQGFVVFQRSQSTDVVYQSVEPYVYNVFRVERHFDAPVEASTGYAQIFEALFYELNHFITTGFRLDEIRIVFDEFQPTVSVFVHAEEVAFFFNAFYGATAVRTGVVFTEFLFRPERFARRAIPSAVFGFIDIAFIIGFLK